ncbi:MAG: TIGR04211 family SH3 domain-containing protein [Alteromonadaceae bacterium]|nr:TIGR04211 family SH3 domain-containing protein [Alteromonadaceae bacterium]
MKSIKNLFTSLIISLSLPFLFQAVAEELPAQTQSLAEAENSKTAYIADNLFIFLHTGAGKNYRIIGSINAGTEISLTGKVENDFSEIIDDKNRTGWIDSQFVSANPGLRFVIAELNGKLAGYSESGDQLSQELDQAQRNIEQLRSEHNQQASEIVNLNKQLLESQSQVKAQDTNVKKEWFFNGAIVLAIGLILGLIIPKLIGSRRSSSMDSWS